MFGLKPGTVTLVPFDNRWKSLFEQEAEYLKSIAGGQIRSFEHIGSTAVEELVAKPIIDMIGVVENLEESVSLLPLLEEHGYEHEITTSNRHILTKGPSEDRRTFHLSLSAKKKATATKIPLHSVIISVLIQMLPKSTEPPNKSSHLYTQVTGGRIRWENGLL